MLIQLMSNISAQFFWNLNNLDMKKITDIL